MAEACVPQRVAGGHTACALCAAAALTRPAPPSHSHVPNVLWAERSDRLFITVEVTDTKDPKVDISDEGVLTVAAKNGEGVLYQLRLELLHPVDSKARAGAISGGAASGLTRGGAAQESKVAVTPRGIAIAAQKAEPGPHWGKLLKGAGKAPHYVKVDWSKFVDEDEEANAAPGAPPSSNAASDS